jgi:DNA-binding MarR family transcriptional regulator
MTLNITANEQAVLDALHDRDGGIYANEIGSYSGLSGRVVSGVVSSLVKKGMIRCVSADDEFGDWIELHERVVVAKQIAHGPNVYLRDVKKYPL